MFIRPGGLDGGQALAVISGRVADALFGWVGTVGAQPAIVAEIASNHVRRVVAPILRV